MKEPLRPDEARRLIRQILTKGVVSPSDHTCREMANDALDLSDCLNVLRAGVVEEAELCKGTWRYRMRTSRIVVVVAFRGEAHLRIVTAWRARP